MTNRFQNPAEHEFILSSDILEVLETGHKLNETKKEWLNALLNRNQAQKELETVERTKQEFVSSNPEAAQRHKQKAQESERTKQVASEPERARQAAQEAAEASIALKAPLIDILNRLIENLRAPGGGGRSKYLLRGRGEKIATFEVVKKSIEGKENFTSEDQANYLSFIRDKCATKRNPIGFFPTHSSIELQTMINKFNIDHPKLSANEKINFDEEEMSDLNSNKLNYLMAKKGSNKLVP